MALWNKAGAPAAVEVASTEGASSEPVTQSFMAQFMQELKSEIGSLRSEVQACVKDLRKEVGELGGRMDDMEKTLDARTEDQEHLWQRLATLEEQHIELQVKQEDLENRGRRNNIRLRGIPPGAEGADIMSFVADLLHEIQGDDDTSSPALDRAHRVAPPSGRPGLVPDILARVHFFVEKEAILKAARDKPELLYKGKPIQLFQDLAPLTLQCRRAFRPITDKLRDLNIRYQWGHPFALIFQWETKRQVVRSYREAAQMLHMPTTPPASPSRPPPKGRVPLKPQWTTVHRDRRPSVQSHCSSSREKQDIIQRIRSLGGGHSPSASHTSDNS